MQCNDVYIRHPSRTSFAAMLDVVLLLVEFTFAEQVIDRFIILFAGDVSRIRISRQEWNPYDFEKLAFHFIHPAFVSQLLGNSKDLLYCSWYHSCCSLSLRRYVNTDVKTRNYITLTGPPSIVNDFPDPVWPYAKMQTLYPSMQL